MTMARLKIMNKMSFSQAGMALLMLMLTLAACTSRYRLDLFLTEGDTQSKVKVEKTEFMAGAVLGDPMSRDKVKLGDGNVIVLITGSRGRTVNTEAHDLMSYDRYARYRLFVQLAATIEAGPIVLKDNSLLQMMGRYELDAEDKLYYPIGGELVVDSLSGNKLFGTIDGRFENHKGDPISLEGRFKAKISD